MDAEVTKWADVASGDVVLGVDNRAYYVVARHGRTLTLRHPDDKLPVTGNPPPDQKLIRLLAGPTTCARRTLAAAGLQTELLYEGDLR